MSTRPIASTTHRSNYNPAETNRQRATDRTDRTSQPKSKGFDKTVSKYERLLENDPASLFFKDGQLSDMSLIEMACTHINNGQNGLTHYSNILERLQTWTQTSLILNNCKHLKETLVFLRDKMPQQVRNEFAVSAKIEQIWLLIHTLLKKELAQTTSSSMVSNLQKLASCPDNLNSELKSKFQKIQYFSLNKYFVCDFLEECDKKSSVTNVDNIHTTTQTINTTRAPKRAIYPILSIDGGGIRGIIPATMLVAIEGFTRKPISKLFKLIGGTSTGGILALGLTKPNNSDPNMPQYSAQDLLNLYTTEHRNIFRENPLYSKQAPTSSINEFIQEFGRVIKQPKYLAPVLFNTKFGNTLLNQALTDVVIVTNTQEAVISKMKEVATKGAGLLVSLGSQIFGGPAYKPPSICKTTVHLFTREGFKKHSYNLDTLEDTNTPVEPSQLWSMAQAAQATSAAPTFFPVVTYPHPINPFTLVDGGCLHNNPAISCVLEAKSKSRSSDNLFLVSLGTGIEGIQDYEPDMFNLWSNITQPEDEEKTFIKRRIGYSAYHRFQYFFKGPAPKLDDCQFATIRMLEENGRELVKENEDYLREICKVLDPESV